MFLYIIMSGWIWLDWTTWHVPFLIFSYLITLYKYLQLEFGFCLILITLGPSLGPNRIKFGSWFPNSNLIHKHRGSIYQRSEVRLDRPNPSKLHLNSDNRWNPIGQRKKDKRLCILLLFENLIFYVFYELLRKRSGYWGYPPKENSYIFTT